MNWAGVCCGGINNTGRSRGRKVRWAGRCDAVIRADAHSRHLDTKQVDRSKAFLRTRIPIAKPIMLVYHYKAVACLSACRVVIERKEPNSLPLLLISFSQVPLTPHFGVFGSTSSLRWRRFPGGLFASLLFRFPIKRVCSCLSAQTCRQDIRASFCQSR